MSVWVTSRFSRISKSASASSIACRRVLTRAARSGLLRILSRRSLYALAIFVTPFFHSSAIRRRCRLRRRRLTAAGMKAEADRNHHGLRSRPDFDRRMELAGLEPATSWVRSVGDRGLRGTARDVEPILRL